MKKLTITSILALVIACPSFATVDIAADAESAGCTNSVLKTYTGPTELEADWTANQISINFYSDENTVYSTGTCTYDGGIELPATDPTKTGYTFDGWTVRRAAAGPAPAKQCYEMNQTECESAQECVYSLEFPYYKCMKKVSKCEVLNKTECDRSAISINTICGWSNAYGCEEEDLLFGF